MSAIKSSLSESTGTVTTGRLASAVSSFLVAAGDAFETAGLHLGSAVLLSQLWLSPTAGHALTPLAEASRYSDNA